MLSNPLISIIIPTYNEEKDIEQCLISLNEQDYTNKEIIIVDDGSTDNTVNIIKNFPNINVFKGIHGGAGYSRNIGSQYAKGEILIFIDADMTFEKNYLKNLIGPIVNDRSEEIIGTTHDYEVVINTENWISNLWGPIRVSREQAKNVKIFRAIRKDKFLELGGFDLKFSYADDQSLWIKYKVCPVVANNTTCYHKNPETLTSTFKQAKWIGSSWIERFKIFKLPIIKHLAIFGLFIILLPLIFAKSSVIKAKSNISIFKIIKYYSYKFTGYAVGIFKAMYKNEVFK